jgi:hypothetical protein
MGMPEAAHGNAGQGIEVGLAVRINQLRALTVTEIHCLPGVGCHKRIRHGVPSVKQKRQPRAGTAVKTKG